MKTVEGTGEGAAPGEAAGLSAGYEALASGCAVADPPAASWLELVGEDRLRFLNGQTTCDLRELGPGAGAYGFLLNVKGRVLADAVITVLGSRLIVELPPAAAEDIAEHLRRYVVADRVEIASFEPPPALLVAGPGAAASLARIGDGAETPADWARSETGPESRFALRGEKRLGVPAWRLEAPAADLAELRRELERGGAVGATAADLEITRIERGIARSGLDYDAEHFPQETGLEDWAVSYTKGCYIGQEVVARIHYRGKVNRGLRGLAGAPDGGVPPPGPVVDAGGEPAGRLGSIAWSPRLERALGLAVLHRRAFDPGTTLRAESGAELEVVELPFVRAVA